MSDNMLSYALVAAAALSAAMIGKEPTPAPVPEVKPYFVQIADPADGSTIVLLCRVYDAKPQERVLQNDTGVIHK